MFYLFNQLLLFLLLLLIQIRRDDFEEEDDIESYVRHMKSKGIVIGKSEQKIQRREVKI